MTIETVPPIVNTGEISEVIATLRIISRRPTPTKSPAGTDATMPLRVWRPPTAPRLSATEAIRRSKEPSHVNA